MSDGGSNTTDITAPLLSNEQTTDRMNESVPSSGQKNVQPPDSSISIDSKLAEEDMNVATDAVLIDINEAVNDTQQGQNS